MKAKLIDFFFKIKMSQDLKCLLNGKFGNTGPRVKQQTDGTANK